MIRPNTKKALFLATRQLSELVCDAINLEGIPFTLPEVQTLLDGVTVGGHKISDEHIALNQINAWKALFSMIESNTFSLSAETACKLHAIAANEDALEWGKFRSGSVTIAGTNYRPPKAEELDQNWETMIKNIEIYSDPYEKAIVLFLKMSRNQFFYDVNRRMGRFMMNGLLLQKGYPVINLPAKRRLEFNQLMLSFYSSDEMEPMIKFMTGCLDPRVIEIMSEF